MIKADFMLYEMYMSSIEVFYYVNFAILCYFGKSGQSKILTSETKEHFEIVKPFSLKGYLKIRPFQHPPDHTNLTAEGTCR